MQGRIIRILAVLSFVVPAVSVALVSADPQPMKPVEKGKRRITERHNDNNRDRDRHDDGARDRSRGWDHGHDRGVHRGPNRATHGLRPATRPEGEWLLGLRGDDTDTGVRVTGVVQGSAAERAGFEHGDLIVNVSGYQVGVVDGRRYDLGEELQRQADPVGRVTLLVQNRRTRELQNVTVQMQWVATQGRIFGRISYRQRTALPSNAVCFVELVELDRASRPIRVMQKQLVNIGSGPSARFQLNYDPRTIDPNRRYAVQARVEANGRVLMDTPGTHYVITQGGPERVELELVGRVYRGAPRGGVHRGHGGRTRIRKR